VLAERPGLTIPEVFTGSEPAPAITECGSAVMVRSVMLWRWEIPQRGREGLLVGDQCDGERHAIALRTPAL
jgi:hypothetical protein